MKHFADFLANCQSLARTIKNPGLPEQFKASKRRELVDNISNTFLDGYDAALHTDLERLAKQIESQNATEKSVLSEGALTALVTEDLKKQNNLECVSQLSQHIDIKDAVKFQSFGYAISHLNLDIALSQKHMEEFWGWQTMDAYGFHESYFKWPLIIEKQIIPNQLTSLALRAFDQGMGRAIWFLGVAEPNLILKMINRFPPQRRPDIWVGIGMMASFWGMIDERDLKLLLRNSKKYYSHLQQGVALGAWIRHDSKEYKDHTDGACRIICKVDSTFLGAEVQRHLEELLATGHTPNGATFIKWRDNIGQNFTRPI